MADRGGPTRILVTKLKQIGDVLLAWENEAFLALKEQGGENFEIVVPSLSILAEPPVAVVDKNVERKGTHEVAGAYLNYLYSEEGQRIAAKNFYRPRNEAVAAEFKAQFPALQLVTPGIRPAGSAHFLKLSFVLNMYLARPIHKLR